LASQSVDRPAVLRTKTLLELLRLHPLVDEATSAINATATAASRIKVCVSSMRIPPTRAD
jgi:hypothetical protein